MHNIKVNLRIMLICLLYISLTSLGAVNYQIHKVKKGDTLYSLSKRYGVTVNELMKLNNLSSSNLSLGQKLKVKPEEKKKLPQKEPKTNVAPITIQDKKNKVVTTEVIQASEPIITTSYQEIPANLPEDYFHVTLPKENLYRIALNANITLVELLRFNNFPDAHVVIKPGQKLVIKDPALFKKTNIQVTTSEQVTKSQEEDVQPAEGDSVVIEKVYIVQRKDTLFKIARENNMTVEELKRRNNLTNNSISMGQKLYIVAPKGKVVNNPVPTVITEDELKTKTKLRTDLIMPVDGRVISEYGIRNGRPHKGIDIAAANGMPIYAVLDGTVVYAGLQGNYGNVVVIEHPDYIMTVYGHNEKNLVAVGDIVKQGQVIATTGSTGNATCPHVHFEYRIKGKAINPRKVLPIGQ